MPDSCFFAVAILLTLIFTWAGSKLTITEKRELPRNEELRERLRRLHGNR